MFCFDLISLRCLESIYCYLLFTLLIFLLFISRTETFYYLLNWIDYTIPLLPPIFVMNYIEEIPVLFWSHLLHFTTFDLYDLYDLYDLLVFFNNIIYFIQMLATINMPKVQAPFGVSLLHPVLIIQGYNQNYMKYICIYNLNTVSIKYLLETCIYFLFSI